MSDTSSTDVPVNGDTALGPIPASVRSLAVAITGGQTSPLDKAEALTDFFRSGEFHYKIDATQPGGVDPLVAFLSRTRTGSCEEFAGAFAVLAREAGLTARVAVGFTPGRTVNGVAVIRGSDAHAWPQVLIGATWVSFKPHATATLRRTDPTGPVLGPPTRPRQSDRSCRSTARVHPGGGDPDPDNSRLPPSRRPPVRNRRRWLVASAIVLIVLVAIMEALLVRRRRHRSSPVDRLSDAWGRLTGHWYGGVWLGPCGALRRRTSVPCRAVIKMTRPRAAIEDMTAVASALEDVTYGSAHLTEEDAELAGQAGERARRAILAGAVPRPGHADSGGNGLHPRPEALADVESRRSLWWIRSPSGPEGRRTVPGRSVSPPGRASAAR